ncbi:HAMP domain-containing histidine kinase [Leucobacter viscericola]|uniref:histidine kinase n=1 Tax=Leucobacter viscericola TaxID=2714935 RepID=A0A6G7XGT5_9MICO|nr:HAMP domain-containing sensor histidine kinase [Leucobacter viscericola]QIK63588.1 HAMP domain-containing histidine kinase [Leucobacter viscericola]
MRLRLLVPLLAFGLVAIGALVVPAAVAIAQQRTQQLERQRVEAFDQIVQRSYAAVAAGGSGSGADLAVLDRYLERFYDTYQEPVMVADGAGVMLTSVGQMPAGAATDAAVSDALRGIPQLELPTVYPWSDASVVAARPLKTEGNVSAGVVVIGVSQERARQDVALGWVQLGSVGLMLIAGLLVLGVAWSRWVLRPVRVLDAAANALAEQRRVESTGVTGPPELRRLAASFERMAHNVEAALEQQRGLIADASHQLRNPLAAIRLRIDALAPHGVGEGVVGASREAPGDVVDGATADDIAAIMHDLDRLESTLERMLKFAHAEHRASRRQSEVAEVATVGAGGAAGGAGAVGASGAARSGGDAPAGPAGGDEAAPFEESFVSIATLVEPHRHALAAAGVQLSLDGESEPVRIACNPSDLEEMVEILLDNASKYAGSGATVTVAMSREPERGRVILRVSDSGPGLSDRDLEQIGTRFWRAPQHREQPGTGLGHAIVEQIAYGNRAAVRVDRAPEGGLRTQIELRAL